MNELIIPPSVVQDTKAVEMARVWHAAGRQHISLNAPGWKDPAAWGLLLADMARMITDAYVQAEGRDRQQVLSRIKAGLEAELNNPTDPANGKII